MIPRASLRRPLRRLALLSLVACPVAFGGALAGCSGDPAAGATTASAASALVGGETLLGTGGPITIAPDGKGGFLAVWAESAPRTATLVRAAFLDGDGKKVSGPFTAITAIDSAEGFGELDLAAGEGGYLLVFTHSDGAGARPAALPIDAFGVPDPAGWMEVGDTSSALVNPRVAFDGSKFVVTWSHGVRSPQPLFEVRAAEVDPGRSPAVHPFALPAAAGFKTSGALACRTGECMVVWTRSNAAPAGVYGARVAMRAPAPVVLDATPILLRGSNEGHRAAVAFDGTNYVIAWRDRTSAAAPWSIVAARVSPAGAVLTEGATPALGGILIGAQADDFDSEPWPAVANDGAHTLITWQHRVASGQPRRMFGGWLGSDGAVTAAAPGFDVCDIEQQALRTIVLAGRPGAVLTGYPRTHLDGLRLLTFDPSAGDAGLDAAPDATGTALDAAVADGAASGDGAVDGGSDAAVGDAGAFDAASRADGGDAGALADAGAPADAGPVDSGAKDAGEGRDASLADAGRPAVDAGAGVPEAGASSDSGCGCATAGTSRSSSALPIAGTAGIVAVVRRRRRSRRA